jgi:lipopolysaccharide export system protein LptA
MFKIVLTLLWSVALLFGADEEVRIEANLFEANEKDRISIFSGNVRIRKGFDEINSSVVKIYFSKDNQPEKYEILRDVSFVIKVENDSTYTGKAQKVFLFPSSQKYIFSDLVEITEQNSGRTIRGNRVSLNMKNGNARISGGSRSPVVMTFKVPSGKERE